MKHLDDIPTDGAKCLNKKIERNIIVYVDDMVVKSEELASYALDVQETFEILR